MSNDHRPTDTEELLSTKIAAPYLRAPLVTRDTLLARMDSGFKTKLTLVSAPAGFGKTTLVSQWMQERMKAEGVGMRDEADLDSHHPSSFILYPSEFAWVSLDPDDNDPVRFWRYVLTASQAFAREISQASLSILNQPSEPLFEALLTGFINQAALLEGKAVIVLDDYHVITAPQIHKTLAYLLEYLPPTLHIILVTRNDPPLPLGRMRARNELLELRAEDLRFSLDETRAFVEQSIPEKLSTEIVSRLAQRTEGWVAGLHLVALTLQNHQNEAEIQQFLETFTGSLRTIQEYLVEEVFSAQSEDLQEFLLRTSFLNRLTGSLCDAVTGRGESTILLDRLVRANLFLTSLDTTSQWYRFHALFSEAMQHYARQRLGEAQIREVHHNASLWFEEHGLLPEAIETALSSFDFPRAARLIQRMIASRQALSEKHTLRRWMDQIPEEVLRTHPAICMAYAMAILFTSDRHAPATHARLLAPLQIAEEHLEREGNKDKLGQVLAFRSLAAWMQRDLSQSFPLARQALELLPQGEVEWRGISLVLAGTEELYAGKLNDSRQTLTEARVCLEAVENIFGVLDSTLLLGEVCYQQGELHQSSHLYRQVIARLENAPMDRDRALFRRVQALLGLGTLALEQNDLKAAGQYVAEGIAISQQFPDEDLLARGRLVLARIKHARGETEQAQAVLGELTAQAKFPIVLREARADQARLSLAMGDLAAVQRWYAGTDQQTEDIFFFSQEQEAAVVARLLIVQGQPGDAFHLLEGWLADAQAKGRARSEMEIRILMTLAYAALEDMSQAKQALVRALELAQTEGYRRLFLDEGEPLAAIMAGTLPDIQEEHLANFARALVYAQAQRARRERAPSSGSMHSIEPLSEQEQRVLHLLGEGLTNPEIARELVVSLNTVKTHVKSIYRKLNVSSRREARQAARHLNLV
jgi:LuxR family maltose regulon positive regulatory protein